MDHLDPNDVHKQRRTDEQEEMHTLCLHGITYVKVADVVTYALNGIDDLNVNHKLDAALIETSKVLLQQFADAFSELLVPPGT